MNPGLIDLILFSEKRKAFLLFLREGPKSSKEILDQLQVPRTSILPQIKKLKEQNLVIHEDGMYRLTQIGEIIVEKMKPLLETLDVFEKDEEFWIDRKLSSIPPHLIKRINELEDYNLIEPDLSHAFDLNPEFIKYVSDSSRIHMLLSYFHPQLPILFLELAGKGIEISLVLSESVYSRFAEDFGKEGEEFLKMNHTGLFVLDKKATEIPAVIVASDNIMILGLFNENGRFDRQYLTSFEPDAIKWGEELFEYYMGMARETQACRRNQRLSE
ncbi:winged helix-turn-helix domain-containing protein [Methanosarcina sp. KYL-1]|uniref:helix-turn-helix transcriptional regulator n=1 Tax=Methanosarcina sp. KYL-1 TaxID=2602068 RepID=UPI002100C5E5|nr:winged helix-turn-helix domain-containing protein [Methanosarcina sp. KYL-1]MCQ1534740.1 winged helix-turn-helix domain-containing protein [Methanosarcina sp. KYL-1]